MKWNERKNAQVIVIPHGELPPYHKATRTLRKAQYVKFGDVLDSTNPHAFTQEKKCQHQICRVLYSEFTADEAEVIDESGHVWGIRFSNFKDWQIVEVG